MGGKTLIQETSGLTIERLTQAGEALYAACQRLVPQLTDSSPPPTAEELALLLASPCSFVFAAKHADFDDEIIGLATLLLYRIPTGLRGYIEDVVVDERARGRGIGEALTWACLESAREAGAPYVGLTSNPSRVAANRLYQKMGFVQRDTNVYKFVFALKN
jgi:ribosomal protein S18 acetylase RimI-like enzyme